MTPTPAYAARVPANVTASPLALGILQGRGVRAEHVTPAHVKKALAAYRRILEAETARRNRLGLPLTGSMPRPGEAPVVIHRPPWEA